MKLSQQDINLLNFVRECAEKFGSLQRMILFGSRARHDHRSRSDYDIAVEPDAILNGNWAQFWNLVDEAAPTLCSIDLINLADDLSESFRAQVEAEGIEFILKAGNHETN